VGERDRLREALVHLVDAVQNGHVKTFSVIAADDLTDAISQAEAALAGRSPRRTAGTAAE
jgi:carbohydrate-binding DOMON domain-containing protein